MRRVPRETRVCENPNCDVVFEVRMTGTQKFCSHVCAYKGINYHPWNKGLTNETDEKVAKWSARRKTKTKVTRRCKICGKEFKVYQTSKKKYCSRICFYLDEEVRSKIGEEISKAFSKKKESQPWKTYRKRALDYFGLICEKCKKSFPKNKLVVHHRDFVNIGSKWEDHSLENLMVLCRSCHNKLHIKFGKLNGKRFGVSDIVRGIHYIFVGVEKEYKLTADKEHFTKVMMQEVTKYVKNFYKNRKGKKE